MATGTADKLIAKAAREILKPTGLFQVGTSRTWIDDNGWFLTVVEFQPSSWSKGAYLNVAVSFLWYQGKGFEEVLPYNIGGRELGYIEYNDNEEMFYKKIYEMAQYANKKVEEYRKYSDSSIRLCNFINSPLKVIEAWDKGMLYYFNADENKGDEQMKLLLKYAENEHKYEFDGKMHTRDGIVEFISAAEQLLLKEQNEKHLYVIKTMTEKRQRLRNKAKYKKLEIDSVYQ
ncbi:MAG: hypothetical protein LBU76_09355 [Azoarcus sp.]|nr:hypothetical protein [Azoarcus sp.]